MGQIDLLNFYKDHITKAILPFWMRALDQQDGGIYTCFNNLGTKLISKDKYTWSQGRFLWLWSRLAEMSENGLLVGDSQEYVKFAKKTVDFLEKHAILENGNCAFLLSETGEKKETMPGQGFDTSIYADCFVVLGFSEYARVTKDKQVFNHALRLYDRIQARLEEGHIRSEPYPIPIGFKSHSVSMIMLHITQELAETLKSFQDERYSEFLQKCNSYLEDIMEGFLLEDGRIGEILPKEEQPVPDTVLSRHVNPGHTVESMWFAMTAGDKLDRRDWVTKASQVIKKAFELGWDQTYGGLFRFVDFKGGKPMGNEKGDPYEKLILDTWDTKLWWPHSEALYSFLLAYTMTGDEEFLQLYEQMHEYVFQTFPNRDQTIGEWIQIRDRQGNPIEKIVALPVKDPFHILRNMLLTIELLGDGKNDLSSKTWNIKN